MDDVALLEQLERSRQLGFLGPGPVELQLAHARAFVAAAGDSGPWLDLGSGGGLPGLVMAWDRPQHEGTLLDAMRKRCSFLSTAVDRLGFTDRIGVVCARAEEAARAGVHRGRYRLVMARSFGPPAVTAECAAGFLGVGGTLVVSEPPGGGDRWPVDGLASLGFADRGPVEVDGLAFRVLELERQVDDRYPRRVGIPAKRPLF